MSTWEGQMSASVWYVSARAAGDPPDDREPRRKERCSACVCVCVCVCCVQGNKWEAGEDKMVGNHQSAMWLTSVFVRKIWQRPSTHADPPACSHSCRFHLHRCFPSWNRRTAAYFDVWVVAHRFLTLYRIGRCLAVSRIWQTWFLCLCGTRLKCLSPISVLVCL